ncbi:hypothetical protein R69658_06864 [Paraburkholderia aspalathi]|uniref:Uncharacterized protein n=1 Tax=Paraburkholderia aspalathi TaxID=1324617 RepID=A0ABN7N431_9BURK|nr:hypothetical protein [Paraburkholderia aspalathi]MBK3823198.1 hypothetical protein [Paraburkholderia aspalathi]MBK3835029.1 hypothetical protein [Paraburkholderia aspalathi]MBK3864799.1 hypothetical protein [Paraburkholderia aspalathi]CAE6844205.1 hypothetical protein R69658_06864 [Paraburkholderia aspalathi]
MTQVIDERNNIAGIKIRAVLDKGKPLSTTRAARDVAELFASDIEGSLRGRVAPELMDEAFHALLRSVLEQRLTTMLVIEASGSGADSDSLPVVNLKPSEVIEQRKVRMSLASLYRYVEANKFYCVVPSGQSNGREFPAWQFAGPVPELLPPVLLALRGALRTEVHAFLVTAQDALNELAPAEVLAGSPFETRASLHPSQQRLLQLPASERQRKVLALINGPGASMAA